MHFPPQGPPQMQPSWLSAGTQAQRVPGGGGGQWPTTPTGRPHQGHGLAQRPPSPVPQHFVQMLQAAPASAGLGRVLRGTPPPPTVGLHAPAYHTRSPPPSPGAQQQQQSSFSSPAGGVAAAPAAPSAGYGGYLPTPGRVLWQMVPPMPVGALPGGAQLASAAAPLAREGRPSWCRGQGAAASGDQMEGMGAGNAGIGGVLQSALGRRLTDMAQQVQVVSLGSYCGTKLTLRRLGFGEAHMPFDWMRTTVRGLIHWLRHDFSGFMDWTARMEVIQQEQRMTVFRSPVSSFWHDDLDNDADREKLRRRVQRFLDLVKDPRQALLFVRSVAGTHEVADSENLLQALQERFQVNGRKVYLLVILEDQPLRGPVLHQQHEELFFWVQPQFTGKLTPYLDAPTPFEEAVVFAVRRILRDPWGLYPNGFPGGIEEWPVVESSAALLAPDSPLRKAGLRDTSCGVWAGNVRINGLPEEVMLAAFDGLDQLSAAAARVEAPAVPAALPMVAPPLPCARMVMATPAPLLIAAY